MTKSELLQIAKPILFNGDMVGAIFEGKSATRRAVKYKYSNTEMKMRKDKYGIRLIEIQKDVEGETHGKKPDGGTWHKLLPYIEKNPPCKKGDILYVQETWKIKYLNPGFCMMIRYRADDFCNLQVKFSPSRFDKFKKFFEKSGWQSPYFMPKEVARIFLKVTDVKVQRLHDMTLDDFLAEGATLRPEAFNDPENAYWQALRIFAEKIWDKTLKKADREFYSWDANPWVWAIAFDRVYPDDMEG